MKIAAKKQRRLTIRLFQNQSKPSGAHVQMRLSKAAHGRRKAQSGKGSLLAPFGFRLQVSSVGVPNYLKGNKQAGGLSWTHGSVFGYDFGWVEAEIGTKKTSPWGIGDSLLYCKCLLPHSSF